jgi:small conductance mechanosensitive channel
MDNILEKMYGYVIQYGLSLVYAILIIIIGKWVAKLCSKIAEKLMKKAKINETLLAFSKNIIYYVLLIFVIIAALNKLGIETTSFVAIVGAAGLAVGLALQGTLANFAAGIMLIIFQPFKLEDEIEAAGAAGTVKDIQIFSTILETKDNKKIIIPNAKITADKITIIKK